MPADARVLAVVVNWNGGAVLQATLDSLLAGRYDALEVLVVDNASTDGSAQSLPAEVKLVELPENTGYAGGVNHALQQYRSEAGFLPGSPDFFLLLNNDVQVRDRCIQILVEQAVRLKAGVVGPKVLLERDGDRLEAAWGKVSWSHVLAAFEGRRAPARDPAWNTARPVQLLLGCALLVRRDVFEKVGLFDERFFMYHEEVDFLYRCQKAGVKVYYCPDAEVRHRSGWSTRVEPLGKVCWVRRNTVLFLSKHRASPARWLYWGVTLLGSVCLNLVFLRGSRLKAILQGVRDGFAAL